MFYRNISRYINKLCGCLQRLVVTARFPCIKLITQTVISDKEKGRKTMFLSVLTDTFQKVPEKIAIMDSVTSDTLISWAQHDMCEVPSIRHVNTVVPRSYGQPD